MFNSASHLQRSVKSVAFAALIASAPALARAASDCAKITDGKDRLACFDAAEAPAKAEAPLPVIASANTRAAYADYLRKFFLSNGVDMAVFWPEAENPERPKEIRREAKRFPMLHFFGWVGNPFIYQLITQGRVLDNARERGFKSVEFQSKGSEGMWIFDLSGPAIPQCDIMRRLCR